MNGNKPDFSVDAYIAAAPEHAKVMLHEIRELIRQAAPDAKEIISYGMPTYKGHSNLVHFAANKAHLGLYPTPSAIEHFKDSLAEYKTSKGSIHFLYDRPLPRVLITKIVAFRVEEDKRIDS